MEECDGKCQKNPDLFSGTSNTEKLINKLIN